MRKVVSVSGSDPDYQLRFKQLQEMESNAHFQHLLLEISLLGTACLMGFLFVGMWQLMLWFIVSYGVRLIDRHFLLSDSPRSARSRYIQHLTFAFIVASLSNCLPAYLWSFGQPVHEFAALAFMICATLNTFLVKSISWPLTLCFLVPNGTVLMYMAISFYDSAEVPTLQANLAVVFAIFVVGYFVSSLVEALRQHRELHETQQKLLQAQKMETLGTLSGGIAHDFNNLLGVIGGNLELLRDQAKTEREAAMLDQSLNATDRAGNLIQRLMRYGGTSHLDVQPVDVENVLQELDTFARRLFPETINLKIEIERDLCSAMTDEGALHASLLNLAVNARDSMENGGTIRISATNLDSALGFGGYSPIEEVHPGYVMISVRDDGNGIDPAILPRIFDPYMTTKPIGKGSGLGLAMVLGFVKQSGGDIRVRSTVGVGTTVDVLLPSTGFAAARLREAKRFDDMEDTQEKDGVKKGRVLIAEDEVDLLSVLSTKLESEGYEVVTAQSGDEALSVLVKDSVFDLLVTDVVMPGETQGLDLVRRVADQNADMKFIITSGYSPSQKGLPRHLNDRVVYLGKPVSLKMLTQHADELLASKPVQ